MSIKARLEDAQLFDQANRAQGALLSLVVAVAATSRKRRPRPRPASDSDAFTRFLGEEMLAVTGGAVANYFVRFRSEKMRLEQFLYTFVRNSLAHEATLPNDVRFVPAEDADEQSINITDDAIIMTDTWMNGLAKVVRFGPENADEFAEVGEMPEDVIKWFLFGKRRNTKHVPQYWEERQAFAKANDLRLSCAESQRTEESVPELRSLCPRLYDDWIWPEEASLEAACQAGKTIEEIAKDLDRRPDAVQSRLKKLGLIE